MRVLVTGAKGQVGCEFSRLEVKRGIQIRGLERAALDITDPSAVEREIGRSVPGLVVNAAAYTAVDRAESEADLAYAVNRDGPAYLASACAKAGIPLVHISTDYVFNGSKRGSYVETDPVSPLGVYGKSKAAGEEAVRSRLDEHLILRTAWVYGVHGHNFVRTMLRLGLEREVVRVVADQYGCPTHAADIAETIITIACSLSAGQEVGWGTYHYCGKGITSWHGFAEEIYSLARRHAALKVKMVEPISTTEYPTPAKRPTNSVLDCSKLEKEFGIDPRLWPESLERMIAALLSIK